MLLFVEVFQHHAEGMHALARLRFQVQVQHRVLQCPPHQEFQRQIIYLLNLPVTAACLGAEPIVHLPAANRCGQGEIAIVGTRLLQLTPLGETQ